MANEEEAMQQRLNQVKANASSNEEQQQIAQTPFTLEEESETEVITHQNIDEYDHI